jgi:hypothetical protein
MSIKNQSVNSEVIPYNMPPQVLFLTKSYFEELAGLKQVLINQKTSCVDCLCSICLPNKYEVLNPNTNNKLYELQEFSNFCERFCFYRCRGFKMIINNFVNSINNISVILEGRKACTGGIIECFGCGKPKILVDVKTPQGFVLGKIAMNWKSCCCPACTSRIDIIDNAGILKYVIKANCFSIGTHCYFITKCCDILYHIKQNKEKVGKIEKISCDSCRTCITKADQFCIYFPPNATPEEKMLLIIGAILIDYQSFYLC